jgi:hypothetical protein
VLFALEKDEFARSHEKEMRIGYCCDRNSESRKERLCDLLQEICFSGRPQNRNHTVVGADDQWQLQTKAKPSYKTSVYKQNPAKIFQKYFFASFIPNGNWQHLE